MKPQLPGDSIRDRKAMEDLLTDVVINTQMEKDVRKYCATVYMRNSVKDIALVRKHTHGNCSM